MLTRVFLIIGFALLPLRADNVLFVGNSFTFGAEAPMVVLYGGVPKLFEAIARAKGKEVTAWSVVGPGKDFAWHLKQPATANALAARTWNWVVLQDYSTRPTHVGDIPGFLRDGATFSDRIAVASPHAGIILYETWARPAVFYTGAPGHDFTGAQQMMAELHNSYAQLAANLAKSNPNREVRVAQVGTAFARTGDEDPMINLNAKDDHHSTKEGYYLAALVIYETIYHDSAKGAPTSFMHGLLQYPPDVAAKLQAVADEIAATPATPSAAPAK